jgi:hypothetical protein
MLSLTWSINLALFCFQTKKLIGCYWYQIRVGWFMLWINIHRMTVLKEVSFVLGVVLGASTHTSYDPFSHQPSLSFFFADYYGSWCFFRRKKGSIITTSSFSSNNALLLLLHVLLRLRLLTCGRNGSCCCSVVVVVIVTSVVAAATTIVVGTNKNTLSEMLVYDVQRISYRCLCKYLHVLGNKHSYFVLAPFITRCNIVRTNEFGRNALPFVFDSWYISLWSIL